MYRKTITTTLSAALLILLSAASTGGSSIFSIQPNNAIAAMHEDMVTTPPPISTTNNDNNTNTTKNIHDEEEENTETAAHKKAPASIKEDYFMINTDMGRPVVYFISPQDELITVDLSEDPNWPGGAPLHTLIMPDGKKAYLTTMSSENDPASLVVLEINNIDWNASTADVEITDVIEIAEAGTAPVIAVPNQTDSSQPVTSLWIPNNVQIHGPTLHPTHNYAYFTEWTDNKIHVIDAKTDRLAGPDPIQDGIVSRQLHGIFFNPSGTMALATGYYFDLNHLVLYDVEKGGRDLALADIITLERMQQEADDEEEEENGDNNNGNNITRAYAAFPHFVTWLNDRYAITSTQQTGPTSATPSGIEVIGPSVWLVDADTGKAEMIIGPADSPESEDGIYKPASDTAVIGNKLYVAEEDSMDEEINEDGYVSVWDISDVQNPEFIKRLAPGNGLPEGFQLGHALYPTPDGNYVYVQSWSSAHLVKIDTSTDEVVHVFDEDNAEFVMPHGGFITGTGR